MYKEGELSTFSHNGRRGLVDDLIAIAATSPVIEMQVDELSWIIDHCPAPTLTRVLGLINPDEPIIVTYEGDRWVVLDGFHRLYYHIMTKRQTIEVRVVANVAVYIIAKEQHKMKSPYSKAQQQVDELIKQDPINHITVRQAENWLVAMFGDTIATRDQHIKDINQAAVMFHLYNMQLAASAIEASAKDLISGVEDVQKFEQWTQQTEVFLSTTVPLLINSSK